MIKAILLDLDDTLLDNRGGRFVGAYLDLAEQYFYERLRVKGMRQALVATIEAMQAARDYHLSNTAVALQAIASVGGMPDMANLAEAFDLFYTQPYMSLRDHTAPVTGNLELVNYLSAHDYAVVIATNPVYPAEAIRQRLVWAGLPGDLSAYAFVTTGDNMHFIKPDPAYYVEILARVGVEPDEAVMVGNSQTNDIAPAREVGITTYWVTDAPDENALADKAGTLGVFHEAVLAGWLDERQGLPLTPEMVLAELRGNVGALFGLLDEVQGHQWTQHPDAEEWSIIQVVCHLLEREVSVQRPRLERIAREDNPFLSAPPSPTNPVDRGDGFAIAQGFAAERERTLQWLASLSADEWQRPARHSIFSNTSLVEMAHFTAQHDRLHITQICQTLGRCD